MNRKPWKSATVAITLTAVALLTACEAGGNYPAGPSGTVTAKTSKYRKADGWHYELQVDGKAFRVTRAEYKSCNDRDAYPACAK